MLPYAAVEIESGSWVRTAPVPAPVVTATVET